MLPLLRTNTAFAPLTAAPVNRMDSFFDRVLGDFGATGQPWSSVPVAMWEDEERISIEAEMPGVMEQDVDVTVHNGMLFIRGERKPEEGRRYLYNGRSYGRFERAITLPVAVDVDDVHATLVNGVLRVDLPKSPEAKPKKITLRAD